MLNRYKIPFGEGLRMVMSQLVQCWYRYNFWCKSVLNSCTDYLPGVDLDKSGADNSKNLGRTNISLT